MVQTVQNSVRAPSLARRAVEAIALLVGFYLLVAAVALVMIATPVLEVMLAGQLHVMALAIALAGFALLWALVPRREQWLDPGPRFDSKSQPELWAMVERIAAQTHQPLPHAAYLLDDVNAFVAKRNGRLGFGGTRVLAVGVPLMAMLSEDELEAVLAHEFGHFYGGDTKFGPLVYATRGAMGRTLAAARGDALYVLFRAYAGFYLKRTRAISRAQELSADQLSARVTSPATAARALARVEIGAAAFSLYRNEDYIPVIEAGRRPPYFEGLAMALRSPTLRQRITPSDDATLGRDAHSPYDSHPPTHERVRALGADPATLLIGEFPTRASLHLLQDFAAVEAELVRRQLRVAPESLAPVTWEATTSEVLVPSWRHELARILTPAHPRLRPADLPVDEEGLAELGDAVFRAEGTRANRVERIAAARRIGARVLMVAATDAGWTPSALVGEPLRFVRDGDVLSVVEDWFAVCRGEIDPVTWRASLARAGMEAGANDVQVATVPAEPTAPVAPGPSVPYRVTPRGQRRFGTKHELVLDGPALTWKRRTLSADDITSIRCRSDNNRYEVRFGSPSGDLVFRLIPKVRLLGSANKAQLEAWQHVVQWAQRHVEPRLIDAYLDDIRLRGSVDVAGIRVRRDGIEHKGTLLPWSAVTSVGFAGNEVVIWTPANNLDGAKRLTSVRLMVDNAIILPDLIRAAASL